MRRTLAPDQVETVGINHETSAVVIGTPVYVDASDGFKMAKSDGSTTSRCIAIEADVSVEPGAIATLLLSGRLTATTVQWDAVAGTTGGLTHGATYYLSATTAGRLTSTAPTTVGLYRVAIGRALSSTVLIVEIDDPVLLTAAPEYSSLALTNDESGSVVCGTPVYSDASGAFKKAKADAAGTCLVVGLVTDTSVAAAASGTVATGGVVTLTTTQWDAIMGTSGGLTFGTLYFLSDATAGLGTATRPTTAAYFMTPLGKALSTTELELMLGAPVKL